MLVAISLDEGKFNSKPTSRNVKAITKRIAAAELTIADLAQAVILPGAQTWSPGIFTNGRTNDAWQSQQLFALDIDEGLTFDDFMTRANEYGILPAFVYSTFSAVDNNKYRAVYALPVAVTDFRVRQVIQLALMRLYPEADKGTKDAARLWHGGKELLYTSYESRLDVMHLIESMIVYTSIRDKGNAPRSIRVFSQDTGLDMINGLPHIVATPAADTEVVKNDESMSFTLRILGSYSQNHQNITFYFNGAATDRTARQAKKYAAVSNTETEWSYTVDKPDWQEIYDTCPVYRDHMNGIDIHHDVSWFLATNLAALKGGEDRFFEGLRKRAEYDENKWLATFNYIRKRTYLPESYAKIHDYYPNVEEITNTRNLVSIAKKDRGIKMITTPSYIDIHEAETRLGQALQQAYASPLGTITVIRSDTGIGKTEQILRVKNTTIALPTHKLKSEVYQRMIVAGNTALLSPELPSDLPDYITTTLDGLYAMGAIWRANMFLRNEAENNPDLAEYVEAKDATAGVKGENVLTTHARLPYLETTNDTIIIDEDILPTLLQQSYSLVKDVMYLRELIKPYGFGAKAKHSAITSALDYIIKADYGLIFPMPRINANKADIKALEDTIASKPIKSNVISLLSAQYFVKDAENDRVHYITVKNLPMPNKRIIVLSATASEWMYKRLYGDRVSFVDIGRVKPAGTIKQYPYPNASRYALKLYPENATIINKIVGSLPSITYDGYEHLFDNAQHHFGAIAGLDSLSGKDIAVIGTPHMNVVAYLLIASVLNVDVRLLDMNEPFYTARIIRNGFEFYMMTYSQNPDLQEIQLHLIESELQQAIGRARHLRNDVAVLVFSNLPIPGAEIYYYTKAEIRQLISE